MSVEDEVPLPDVVLPRILAPRTPSVASTSQAVSTPAGQRHSPQIFSFDDKQPDCDCEESSQPASFVWEELPSHSSTFTDIPAAFSMGRDAASAQNPFGGAAQLQRRLQAMDDVAERELRSIDRQQQLSPINCRRREIWGDRLKFRPSSSDRDSLSEAARKMAWGGHERSVKPRPRTCSKLQGQRKTIALRKAPTSRPSSSASSVEIAPDLHDPRDQHQARRLHTSIDESSSASQSSQFLCSNITSWIEPEVVGPNSLTSTAQPLTSESLRGLPSSATARATHSQNVVSRNSLLHPSQGPRESPGSTMQAISDPLTLLLMYRRMLVQETNNGLMGGTPFISRPAHAALCSTECSSHHVSRHVVSRGGAILSPLLSRS